MSDQRGFAAAGHAHDTKYLASGYGKANILNAHDAIMPAAGLLDGNVTRENALLDGGGNAVVSEYLPERTAFDCGGRRCIGQSPARSEEHTSELQSLMRISYAVFCLKKKKT